MTIWIDGDGCPRDAVDYALQAGESAGQVVVLVTNVHHEREAKHRLIVDGASQAADLAILNRMQAGDAVITQDIGLAAMVLGKKGWALHPSGHEYDSTSMPLLLEMRESAAKHRRAGHRTRGPKKRTPDEAAAFIAAFDVLLQRLLQASS